MSWLAREEPAHVFVVASDRSRSTQEGRGSVRLGLPHQHRTACAATEAEVVADTAEHATKGVGRCKCEKADDSQPLMFDGMLDRWGSADRSGRASSPPRQHTVDQEARVIVDGPRSYRKLRFIR